MLIPIRISFYYAPEDEGLLKTLKKHLGPLQQQGLIIMQDNRDRRAEAQERGQPLHTARVILPLISPDFMSLDDCSGQEVMQIIEQHEYGKARVIPVILRPTYWQETPFARLQVLPTGGTPLTDRKWRSRDEAALNVVYGIRAVCEALLAEPELVDAPAAPHQPLLASSQDSAEGQRVGYHPAATEAALMHSEWAVVGDSSPAAIPPRYSWSDWLSLHSFKRGRVHLMMQLAAVMLAFLFMVWEVSPGSVLLRLIGLYPAGSPLIGAVLLVLSAAAVAGSYGLRWLARLDMSVIRGRIILSARKAMTAMSLSCLALNVLFLLLAIVRPVWCPAQLCPVIDTASDPNMARDTNLELAFEALHNASFLIPGDPSSYSQPDVPDSVDAAPIGRNTSADIYQVVLSVHNLQSGRFEMLIDQVDIIVDQVLSVPLPLNVWTKGSTGTYTTNPYRAIYQGEKPGALFSAQYLPVPYAHVFLHAGQLDTLTIQISSQIPVSLRFHIQVTYHYANEDPPFHTLPLARKFGVIFSDAHNWHPYRLQNGLFVPDPAASL